MTLEPEILIELKSEDTIRRIEHVKGLFHVKNFFQNLLGQNNFLVIN